jgi:hypothetical protein
MIRTVLTTVLLSVPLLTLGGQGLIVNTEAGSFRCSSSVTRIDSHGVPFSSQPGGGWKQCALIPELKDTI